MAFMHPKYFAEKAKVTCIIADEVGVVFLNAIVQDGHHYTPSCVALSPGYFSIKVLVRWVGLQEIDISC